MFTIKCIDHFVITTTNIQAIISFYEKIGFTSSCVNNENELRNGDFKINVQALGKELQPHAQNVAPGSVDICFHVSDDIAKIQSGLQEQAVPIELGPVQRVGVKGGMTSVYLRDPDGNLIELSSYKNQ